MTTEKRRPLHLGAVVGISAGVYAISLAAVTGLQSINDRALVRDSQPASDAVASLTSEHDRLTTAINKAGQRYANAAGGYERLAAEVGALDKQLTKLAGSVTSLQRANLTLPGAGGSGGGSGGRSSIIYVSSGGLPSVGAAPKPVAAPPVNACTTASGKPC